MKDQEAIIRQLQTEVDWLRSQILAQQQNQTRIHDDAWHEDPIRPVADEVSRAPLTSVKLESGAPITISNTYNSTTRRYLWVDIENRTGEWKLNTQAGFPDKVIIYDGSAGYGSELIITGH